MPQHDVIDSGTPSGAQLTIELARVIKYHPGFNFYTVALARGGAPRKAVHIGSVFGIGVAQHHILTPGTVVLYAESLGSYGIGTRSSYGFIFGSFVGVSPDPILYYATLHDAVSGVGYVFDKVHSLATKYRPDATEPFMLGQLAPLDALAGDFSLQTITGGELFMDMFMSALKANNRCGLWLFRLDEHARLAAKSFELQTFAREQLDIFDTGEITAIERIGLTPWETLGSIDASGVATESSTTSFSNPDKPPKECGLIVKDSNQLPFFRYHHVVGYLGDISQRYILVPLSSGAFTAQHAKTDTQCVFKEFIASDGRYALQSAKGIHLERIPVIVGAVQTKHHHDPEGDTEQTASYSGAYGARGNPSPTIEDRAAELYEYPEAVSLFGISLRGSSVTRQSLANLSTKPNDWTTQRESDVPLYQRNVTAAMPAFDPKLMWQPKPLAAQLRIDRQRWSSSTYFGGRAALDICDDGSIVLTDAWGSQLILSRGNIVLTTPGDIYMMPGRSEIHLAPRDYVIRAGNSVDITATTGDVTIKAQVNLKMLGGLRENKGGILLETKTQSAEFDFTADGQGTNIGGIVLKSGGMIAAYGQRLSLMSETCTVLQTGGRLFASSNKDMYFYSYLGGYYYTADNVVYAFSNSECVLGLPSELEQQRKTTPLTGKETDEELREKFKPKTKKNKQIPHGASPKVYVTGELYSYMIYNKNKIVAGDNVEASGSGIFADGIYIPNGAIYALTAQFVREMKKFPLRLTEMLVNAFDKVILPKFYYLLHAYMYPLAKDSTAEEESRPGAGTYFNMKHVKEKVKFTFRRDSDYQTNSEHFKLGEFQWQYYQRIHGAVAYWRETLIEGNEEHEQFGKYTAPWPGVCWEKAGQGTYTTFRVPSLANDGSHSIDAHDKPAIETHEKTNIIGQKYIVSVPVTP